MLDSEICVETPTRRRPARRGQVIILLALLSSFIISLAGLSVDLILAYAIKTSLGIATDSTALAAMRGLAQGVTVDDQRAEIQRIANMMFEANFPDGLLLTGATPRIVSGPYVHGPQVASDGVVFVNDTTVSPGIREIRILTEAQSPTFFAKAFGVPYVTVRSTAVAARRDTNIMLVMDRSTSLRDFPTSKSFVGWNSLKQAAVRFINLFDNSGDRLGLVSYGTSAALDHPLGHDFKTSAIADLNNQNMPAQGWSFTNTAMGLWIAYAELQALNDPDSLNAIVLFTDGEMTAIPMNFKIRNSSWGSGKPYCSGSTNREFVIRRNGNGFEGPHDLFAAPSPTTIFTRGSKDYDYEVMSGCTNISGSGDNVGTNVEQLLDASSMSNCLNSNWTPSYTASNGTVVNGSFEYRTDPSWSGGNMPALCDSNNFNLNGNSGTRTNLIIRGGRNLAVDISQQARQSSLEVVVYAIGLGTDYQADLLRRIANDPRPDDSWAQSYILDSEPKGKFFWAPSAGDLEAAFQDVGFEVSRLTK